MNLNEFDKGSADNDFVTKSYDFDLPDSLIAKYPRSTRDESRMMVVNRKSGEIFHSTFKNLKDFLPENTLTVLNNTKVSPSRFYTDVEQYEVLKFEEINLNEFDVQWKCLCKPAKRFKVGRIFKINGVDVKVLEKLDDGVCVLSISDAIDDDAGEIALPPYMQRSADDIDASKYQTIFAKHSGSVAAPTAGLHFSNNILNSLDHAFINLCIGPGTFRPVKVDNILNHNMHEEKYYISEESSKKINSAVKILAVGTTVVRSIEDNYNNFSMIKSGDFSTDIFIYPGYKFNKIDFLLTNFHLPKSTLLMLVCAFMSKELTLRAYNEAVKNKYKFYSYGDCMFII